MRSHKDLGTPSEHLFVDGVHINAWYGLRYAIADERFAPSRAATGRIDASHQYEVPIFPQLPSKLSKAMGNGRANPQSEDAFFLNIWAPADAQDLPVIFFIHGGAWMTGGGSMAWYNGSRLAAKGLVVVNVNYRLGGLGHLGSPKAHNLPIPAADILLALQWVIDNIHFFAGNAKKITLMGQSAGGWYAHLLSILPQTQGMIHRVALLSMGTRTPWHPEHQIKVTQRASQLVGGDLQGVSVDKLLKASMSALIKEPLELGYAPSAFLPVASEGIPEKMLDPIWAAQACHANRIYIRYTADESAAFFFDTFQQSKITQLEVDNSLSQWLPTDLPPLLKKNGVFCGALSGLTPYRQLIAASSWRQFQRFPTEYANALKNKGKNVEISCFKTESKLEGFHSGHCFDLPFQFGNLGDWKDAPMLEGFSSEKFENIAQSLIADIASFVKDEDSKVGS